MASDKFPAHKLFFHNSNHPLADLPNRMGKDEFVAEVRRRLAPQRLFGHHSHQHDLPRESVFSIEEAEDLFEVLLLLEQAHVGKSTDGTLKMGRHLDAVVETFFGLHRFRQLMERGASSLAGFFRYAGLR
jgi:hypothetical protein